MTFTQEIEQHNKLIRDLKAENRLLGERCNQLLKDKGELTDKIADLKANFDYVFEGKDLEIKELKMIDEKEKELADKSAFEYFGKAIELVDVQKIGLYKDGFLAGLKAGRPQWHKITDWKDNSQFPNDEIKTYLVRLYQDHYVICEVDITEGYRQFYLPDNLDDIDPQEVLAWCEILAFDKE